MKKHYLRRIKPNNKMRIRIFLQFALILLIITGAILSVARPLFLAIIENGLAREMKSAFSEIENAYNSGQTVSNLVRSIEVRDDIILEIYEKSDSGKFDKNIFCQMIYGVYDSENEEVSSNTPLLDFKNNKFTVDKKYADTTTIGELTNQKNNNRYFVVTKESNDSKLLFVSALNYSVFSNQVKILYSALITIICSLSVITIIALYIYITKVTNPLKKMTEETLVMASTQSEKLRVTTRKCHAFFTEIDSLVLGINKMYKSLLQTKEALMQEIDEKEKAEKIKNDMLSAISHELKTPITIIRGYAEGLPYIAEEKSTLSEYTDTIIGECDRLNNLVMNMLTFLKIGYNSFVIKPHKFDINNLVESYLQIYKTIFIDKGITAINGIDKPIYGFADEELLKYVLNNILSNAVSYIGGGKQIKIRYEEIDGFYRIYVFNSGNGIEPEHIDRIWESFYREDPSRLQIDGHFGLGLSIIKSIQEVHDSKYGVQNTDGGVEFWFDVKKDS